MSFNNNDREINKISAIIVYYERYNYDDLDELFEAYKKNIESSGKDYEFILVVDVKLTGIIEKADKLIERGEKITLIKLGKWFGDATALQIGYEHSVGDIILALPPYQQVEAEDIPSVIQSLDDSDFAIGWRHPRIDSFLNNLQSKVFNAVVRSIAGKHFHDLKCQVKAFKREVLEKIYVYGDQDRFLPLLALQYGFKVKEVKVRQKKKDYRQTLYPLQSYVSRFLELLSMFFLIKFTKKPIRFFGSAGLIFAAIGVITLIYPLYERFFLGEALADRPILLVSVLLFIFGAQSFAIGLIGELIIFTHSKETNKDYIIEEVYSAPKGETEERETANQ